ncbi:hypothetical protein B0H14DRAFT_3501918, partial [Mycena olivaceomarginata]
VEGKDKKYRSKKRRSITELIALGFQLIVGTACRIFAVLAGQPTKGRYSEAVVRAYDFIKAQGQASHFPAAMWTDGPHLEDNKEHTSLAQRLLANEDITRMENFASCTSSSALWAPRLHRHYVDNNAQLSIAFPNLQRPSPSPDVCNLPFGWCAVQSMGRFDPTLGGHLILWDLKMVIEFPAGALILLPSATIAHSNVPVQDGDERISFTQFSLGGLFRYVDYTT